MRVSTYVITPDEWVNDASLAPGSVRNRKRVVKYLAQSNGSTIGNILQGIADEELNVYTVCRRFVEYMRERNLAPTTIYIFRSHLPAFFQSVIGEENFSRTVFDRLIPIGSVYTTKRKMSPPVDGVRRMLQIASPQYRAIVSGLAVSGMRISEWLSRKISDLEIRPAGYARVTLRANETKGRYHRHTFLTREVVEWVGAHQVNYPSEYVFKGENGGYLSKDSTFKEIKKLYRSLGMFDTSDTTYCQHSFRTFAGDWMRECGLPEKAVLTIVGHKNKMGAESAYISEQWVEEQWAKYCSEKMVFEKVGQDPQIAQVKAENERLQNHNGKLELLLEKLLERLST